jgi:glucose-6-phosphate 1-dehydrogenase
VKILRDWDRDLQLFPLNDGILAAWKNSNEPPEPYQAGTWGPVASIALLAREDRAWYESRMGKK